jgi:hypothetical protein
MLSPSSGGSVFGSPAVQEDSVLTDLIGQIGSLLPQGGGSWSVYVADLGRDTEASWQNSRMRAASLIKLFIMGAVYQYMCYPESDEEMVNFGESYDGELRATIEKMITVSDNDAANLLIERLGKGDFAAGAAKIGEFCKKRNIHAKDFQIPHHGNNCNAGRAKIMRQLGAVYCWDDSYSSDAGFLQYGRKRCIEAGIKHYGVHGDINTLYHAGKGVIYKNGNVYAYSCAYKGKCTLRDHTADVVRKVMRGAYGNGETRITNLLDENYKPASVQKSVNSVVSIAKGILNGSMDYGKNQDRINRIDKKLGKGYGQLTQDYINVLCGVRKQV